MPSHQHLLPGFCSSPCLIGLSLSLLPQLPPAGHPGVMTANPAALPVCFVQVAPRCPQWAPPSGLTPTASASLPPPRSSGAAILPPERRAPNCSLCLECSPCPCFLQRFCSSNCLEQWWASCAPPGFCLWSSQVPVFPPLKVFKF